MARSGKHSWFEDSDVLSLFPTLVWKIRLRAVQHEAIDASVLGLLQLLRRGSPELSAGEAWQSGHGLHRRQELRGLCDCVDRAAAGHRAHRRQYRPVVVRVANGMLLVFPSYLQHSVDANASGETRLSVSFNLMFSAFTTALSKPLWGEE